MLHIAIYLEGRDRRFLIGKGLDVKIEPRHRKSGHCFLGKVQHLEMRRLVGASLDARVDLFVAQVFIGMYFAQFVMKGVDGTEAGTADKLRVREINEEMARSALDQFFRPALEHLVIA